MSSQKKIWPLQNSTNWWTSLWGTTYSNLFFFLIFHLPFYSDFKNNNLEQEGWPKSGYTTSKVGVSALSIIQQRSFDEELPKRNIKLNFIHPGWVKTDLNDKGSISPDESAKVVLWLLFDANDDVKGKYIWFDKQIIDWYGPTTPPRPYPIEYKKR